MHNQRISPDVFYVNGAPLPAAYYQALDTAQFKSWNADAGGAWAPAAPIVIGGAGMWWCGLTVLSSGATLTTPLGSGARFTHGANDFVALQAGHPKSSRLMLTQAASGIDVSAGQLGYVPRFTFDNAKDAMKGTNGVGFNAASRLIVPLRVHHGGLLLQLTVNVLVSVAHNGVGAPPTSMPQFRVFAVDTLGNVTNLSQSTTQPGWAGNGFIQWNPAPASGTAWYNGGNVQVFTYTFDNLQVVDTTRFTYFAEIIDEAGVNSSPGNFYTCVVANMQAIPDLRPQ